MEPEVSAAGVTPTTVTAVTVLFVPSGSVVVILKVDVVELSVVEDSDVIGGADDEDESEVDNVVDATLLIALEEPTEDVEDEDEVEEVEEEEEEEEDDDDDEELLDGDAEV